MGAQGKYNSVFPTRLRNLLEDRGTTITALAKELKISRQAASQYVDGSAQPNIDRLVMIARFFDVSSDYLLGLSEYKQHRSEAYTAENMGILEEAAKQLVKDKENSYGISGALLSVLAKSPFFGGFASAVSDYFSAVAYSKKWSNTISSIYRERKNVKMKQFLVNEALFDVLNDVAPLPDFAEKEKTLRIKEGDSHAVDQKKDK